MPSDVDRHYQELLAANYTWMFGVPFAAKVAEQRDLLVHLGVSPRKTGLAVDLGSGPGFQSIALADLGFSDVLAVDTSEALLAELDGAKEARPIRTARADLRALPSLVGSRTADVIVCMGDTLTHLPELADVDRLFVDARDALAPGGSVVLTFRDLSVALAGTDRFLPVRSDDDRILTCFLEFGPDKVTVHDLLHVRTGERWELRKSAYEKLRLAPAAVSESLARAGLRVARSEPAARMWAIVATRA